MIWKCFNLFWFLVQRISRVEYFWINNEKHHELNPKNESFDGDELSTPNTTVTKTTTAITHIIHSLTCKISSFSKNIHIPNASSRSKMSTLFINVLAVFWLSKCSNFPKCAHSFKVSSLFQMTHSVLTFPICPLFQNFTKKLSSFLYEMPLTFPFQIACPENILTLHNVLILPQMSSCSKMSSCSPNILTPQLVPTFPKVSSLPQNHFPFCKCPHFILTFPKCPQNEMWIWKKWKSQWTKM